MSGFKGEIIGLLIYGQVLKKSHRMLPDAMRFQPFRERYPLRSDGVILKCLNRISRFCGRVRRSTGTLIALMNTYFLKFDMRFISMIRARGWYPTLLLVR